MVILKFLLIGTVAMSIPILLLCKPYKIAWWKGIILTILLTIVGALGTYLMFYIENGYTGGISFYGAVFLVPVGFSIIALILRIPYGRIMDLCAVGECIMLALMKVNCMLGGCCGGRILFLTAAGNEIRFPSRLLELIVALFIFAILLRWAWKQQRTGELYAWYLCIYGATRFVLNIFREEWVTRQMLLPYGNIWSLVAVAIGVLWLCGLRGVIKRIVKGRDDRC